MMLIMIMHDADADVMMIIAKRWTNELTFSFVTQGIHGTPCLGKPSSVRRCAVPRRLPPAPSSGCAPACSRSSTARLHRLCVRAPPSSRRSRMTLALFLEIFGRLVVSYLSPTRHTLPGCHHQTFRFSLGLLAGKQSRLQNL